jgi:acetylornithine deacetylase/succinyl-diaminopimelate desuccinylase-like protein
MQPELPPTSNNQPNVIARIKNGPGPVMMLNGHVDTVLAVNGWERDPWQGWQDGDRYFGLGAADMKCGVVANMLVARELHRNRSNWRGTLLFTSVTDEEAYSIGARALMDSGLRADACIVTEPHHAGAGIGAPGKVLVTVEAVGKAAHGFHPWDGINAGIECARFVADVCNKVPEDKHDRVPSSQTVLSIHAGPEQYVITMPEIAKALVTRQIVPGESRESVVRRMEAFAASLKSPAKFNIGTADPYYAPWAFDQPDHAFTRAFASAFNLHHGLAPKMEYMVGITDANVFSGLSGIPCLVYGPRGHGFHQCQEWVDIPSIARCAEVVRSTCLEFMAA